MTNRFSPKAGSKLALELYGSDLRHPLPAQGPIRGGMGHLTALVLGRVNRWGLVSALARGEDPSRSRSLAWCATRLTSPVERERLAAWVEDLIATATQPPRIWSVAIEPCREEITDAAPLLEEVRTALRSDAPVYCQGVAMLDLLLRDGGGPFYRPTSPGHLTAALEGVILALGGSERIS